tara:strand:- start:2120 stop:2320 length:201 start_codon:yes stop_codon:yes gene_type:complete
MKVKLKEGEHLSSMDNYSGLSYDDWLALEQGKTVELAEINKFIKDKVEKVGAGQNEKQPKAKKEKK